MKKKKKAVMWMEPITNTVFYLITNTQCQLDFKTDSMSWLKTKKTHND